MHPGGGQPPQGLQPSTYFSISSCIVIVLSATVMAASSERYCATENSNVDEAISEDMDLHSFFSNTAVGVKTFKILCYDPNGDDDDDKEPHRPSAASSSTCSTALQEKKKHYLTIHLFCSPSACTDYDLTGQIVWPVSVLLSHYLASAHGKSILSGKNVVELGAGVGLPGFVASNFAKKVLLTDGNDFVVESILTRNVSFYKNSRSHVVKQSSSASSNTISVQKFVWGDKEQLRNILQNFGTVEVILAADVVQWPSVLEPLLNSIKALLWKSVEAEPLFILGLVQRAQSTYQEFFDLAKQLGFAWKKVDYHTFLPGGVVPDTCKEHRAVLPEIYELRLTEWCLNPPILLDDFNTETSVTGRKYQFSSLPC